MHYGKYNVIIRNTDVKIKSLLFGGEIMPNIKSAKKRVKVIKKKTLQNQIIKTAIKKFEASLKQGQAAASDAYKVVVKKTDQAVAKGILHKNTASRRKSQYSNMLNKIA